MEQKIDVHEFVLISDMKEGEWYYTLPWAAYETVHGWAISGRYPAYKEPKGTAALRLIKARNVVFTYKEDLMKSKSLEDRIYEGDLLLVPNLKHL